MRSREEFKQLKQSVEHFEKEALKVFDQLDVALIAANNAIKKFKKALAKMEKPNERKD